MVSFKCLKSDLETFFSLNCVSAPAFYLVTCRRITTLFIHFDLSEMHAGDKRYPTPKPRCALARHCQRCLRVSYLSAFSKSLADVSVLPCFYSVKHWLTVCLKAAGTFLKRKPLFIHVTLFYHLFSNVLFSPYGWNLLVIHTHAVCTCTHHTRCILQVYGCNVKQTPSACTLTGHKDANSPNARKCTYTCACMYIIDVRTAHTHSSPLSVWCKRAHIRALRIHMLRCRGLAALDIKGNCDISNFLCTSPVHFLPCCLLHATVSL